MSAIPERLATALADRYRIERELGQGGMATVYLAHDVKHDRKVAIKVLRPELAASIGAERFAREIRSAAALQHPNILPLFDSGEADGTAYYVMPYLEGQTLRDRIARERQLPIDEAVTIAAEVASALEYAHRRGVIHRDIKPENILLHEGRASLADFGIALTLSDRQRTRLTETGHLVGTPQYMSPEQASGDHEPDARTDIYSLGAVLYEMLAGEPPHTGVTPQAVLTRIVTSEPTPLRSIRATIPDHLAKAVAKALAKVPADRFATAAELAQVLAHRLDAPPVDAPAAPQRRGWPVRVAMVTALALALGAIAMLARSQRAGRRSPITYAPVQLTTTGQAYMPVLAPDGSQLAYSARQCSPTAGCSWSIMVRETATDAERPVVTGLTDVFPFQWSRSGLYLLFNGNRADLPFGLYVVSRLGGTPVKVSEASANFLPSGDTIVTKLHLDSTPHARVELYFLPAPWTRVADSVSVMPPSFGTAVSAIRVSNSGRWMAVAWSDALRGAGVTLHDRSGRQTDSIVSPFATQVRWSPDERALLLPLESDARGTDAAALLRVAVDARTGRFGFRDTIQLAPGVTASTAYDLSSDGRTLAYAARRLGQTTVFAIHQGSGGLVERSIASSSLRMRSAISEDGRQAIYTRLTAVDDTLHTQFVAAPFDSGVVRVLTPPLYGVSDFTLTSERLFVVTSRPGDTHAIESFDLGDGRASALAQALPGEFWLAGSASGVALVNARGDTLRYLGLDGRERWRVSIPDSLGRVDALTSSPDGSEFVALTLPVSPLPKGGSNLFDCTVLRISAANGEVRRVRSLAVAQIGTLYTWGADGWLYFSIDVSETGALQLFRMRPDGGGLQPYLKKPRGNCSLSRDARHWVCTRTETLTDIYLIRNFEPGR